MRSILEHTVVAVFIAFLMVTGAHAQIVFTDITEPGGAVRRSGGRRIPYRLHRN